MNEGFSNYVPVRGGEHAYRLYPPGTGWDLNGEAGIRDLMYKACAYAEICEGRAKFYELGGWLFYVLPRVAIPIGFILGIVQLAVQSLISGLIGTAVGLVGGGGFIQLIYEYVKFFERSESYKISAANFRELRNEIFSCLSSDMRNRASLHNFRPRTIQAMDDMKRKLGELVKDDDVVKKVNLIKKKCGDQLTNIEETNNMVASIARETVVEVLNEMPGNNRQSGHREEIEETNNRVALIARATVVEVLNEMSGNNRQSGRREEVVGSVAGGAQREGNRVHPNGVGDRNEELSLPHFFNPEGIRSQFFDSQADDFAASHSMSFAPSHRGMAPQLASMHRRESEVYFDDAPLPGVRQVSSYRLGEPYYDYPDRQSGYNSRRPSDMQHQSGLPYRRPSASGGRRLSGQTQLGDGARCLSEETESKSPVVPWPPKWPIDQRGGGNHESSGVPLQSEVRPQSSMDTQALDVSDESQDSNEAGGGSSPRLQA